MELASKMMQRLVQEDTTSAPRTVPPILAASSAMTDDEPLTPAAFRWGRFMSMLKLITLQAAIGSIVMHLESIRERMAKEALDEAKRSSGGTLQVSETSATRTQVEAERIQQSAPAYADPPILPMTIGLPMSKSTMNK